MTQERTYLVPVAWSMYGRIEVEASSPQEAWDKAKNMTGGHLPVGFYLEYSFEIDEDGILMDEDGNICD